MDLNETLDRFAYHPADTVERVEAHQLVRGLFAELAEELHEVLAWGDSREKSLAFTALQEAAMWANAHVALHFPHGDGTPIRQESS
jgi:hypothetical protein